MFVEHNYPKTLAIILLNQPVKLRHRTCLDGVEIPKENDPGCLKGGQFGADSPFYTGTNYDEVKRLCGDKVLAPYFCMGYSMLSVNTGEGFVSVKEGDTIVREDDGSLRIEK